MDVGRELDVLVAEKVFRYTLDYEFEEIHGAPCVKELRDQYDEWGILPSYSTEIGDAWLVVERAQSWEEPQFLRFCSELYDHGMAEGWGHCWLLEKSAAESAALICRAALAAMEKTHGNR